MQGGRLPSRLASGGGEVIQQAIAWINDLGPLATLVFWAWLIWAVLGLSPYTWVAAGAAGLWTLSQWNWTGSAAADAAGLVAVAGYVVDCFIDPRADCWWCKGKSKRRNARGFFHFCLICAGSGHRHRLGAKAYARHRESRSED